MQTTFALAALAVGAYAAPQIAARDSCATSVSGAFEITVVNATTAKRDLTTRQSTCGQAGYLTLTLNNGQLTDSVGRVGYIASNFQFQFDNPAQPNALSVGGYSVCSNGSLALAGSAIFYECLSGSFYNLYDRSWAAQCSPILIDTLPCGSSSGVGQQSDGQPTGTSVAPVGQSTDGQPTGTAVAPFPVTQITDGQPQVPTAVPVSEFTDGQPQIVSIMPAPVSQISDGQPQAPTSTAAPVSQISDGQPQAPTATAAPVPATTATGAPVTQISDGQPQAPTAAPNATISSIPTPSQVSVNGADVARYSTFAVAVGFAAIFLL